ncbi:MAG: hypothetical protein U9R02_07100 [Thermodesulfobacteriota bacterium]|nr:hypothetical protein [Thermodesulfobacteriota bacterium]
MNKETEFSQDVKYYLLRELASKGEFTQLDLSRKAISIFSHLME